MINSINGIIPGKTVKKLLRQLAPFERTGHNISPSLLEPNRLYDMARAGDKNAKLLRNLVAQLLNKHTGQEWWANKPAIPEGIELLWLLLEWQSFSSDRAVSILSSPSGQGQEKQECIRGKKRWLSLHSPSPMIDAIFQSNKEIFASPVTLLIDDQWRKLSAFSQAGGWTLPLQVALHPQSHIGGKNKLEVIPPQVTTVYCDMDGVLVNTTPSIFDLVKEAFTWYREHGEGETHESDSDEEKRAP